MSVFFFLHQVQMQNMELNGQELISRFKKSNRLDRKDMVSQLFLFTFYQCIIYDFYAKTFAHEIAFL